LFEKYNPHDNVFIVIADMEIVYKDFAKHTCWCFFYSELFYIKLSLYISIHRYH